MVTQPLAGGSIKRIAIAVRYVKEALALTQKYIDIEYPSLANSKKRFTTDAKNWRPSLLGLARIRAATGIVNCEAALLELMSDEHSTTRGSVEIIMANPELVPEDRSREANAVLSAITLLHRACFVVDDLEDDRERNRHILNRRAKTILSLCSEALTTLRSCPDTESSRPPRATTRVGLSPNGPGFSRAAS